MVVFTSNPNASSNVHKEIFSTILTLEGGALNAQGILEGDLRAGVGDFSVAGSGMQRLWIQPPPGETYYINRMITYIEDAAQFRTSRYGAQNQLSSGILVTKSNDAGIMSNYSSGGSGVNITTNGEWSRLCYDVTLLDFGVGNHSLTARWTFQKAGYPIKLVGNNNERLEIWLGDDLTGLAQHWFTVQGYKV